MQHRVILTLALSALLGSTAACGEKRTAAATQTTVAAFDPATSDEQAMAAADAAQTALGGAENFKAIKQLSWTVKHTVEGKLTEHFKHTWDKWNGRHRFEFLTPDQLDFKPTPAQNVPDWTVAMYDIFNTSRGDVVKSSSPHIRASRDEAQRVIGLARQVFTRDAYWFTVFHKLRDPGVILTFAGERQDFYGTCLDGCFDVKVAFVPEVGTDEYHVLINKTTNLPEVLEVAIPGGSMGLKVTGWIDAGGVKFPSGYKNLAADEIFEYSEVKAAEPDDQLYAPELRG